MKHHATTTLTLTEQEIARLESMSDPVCTGLGDQLKALYTGNNIYYYNQYVVGTNEGKTGQLVGIAHPLNDGSGLDGKLGYYKGSRSTGQIQHTLDHESAHFTYGVTDIASDSTSSSYLDWNAEQISNHCGP